LINQSDNILRKTSIAQPTGFTKKTNNMGTIVLTNRDEFYLLSKKDYQKMIMNLQAKEIIYNGGQII